MQDHRTWIELSRQALWHNIATLHALCGSAQLGVVVKANGYGHGMVTIAQLLEQHPLVNWIFVAGTSEGVTLRKQGITKPILALSYIDSDAAQALHHNITCAVYTMHDVHLVQRAAQVTGKQAAVHVKIDSNMSRLGVMPADAADFFAQLHTMPTVRVAGMFTHLSDTNNPNVEFTYEQLRVFDAVVAQHATADMLTHVLL